jgi:hypothetical protein
LQKALRVIKKKKKKKEEKDLGEHSGISLGLWGYYPV